MKILILGAGVGGLRVALRLEKRISSNLAQIILVDENDYHQYLYKIHEVCGSEYDERDIIVPISRLIQGKNIEFKKLKVERIKPKHCIVETSEGELSFDILVIALGSHPTSFGIKGVEENSFKLSSYREAKMIRNEIEKLYESAKNTGRTPRILVAGGGFTGTELAGELTDWLPALNIKNNITNQDRLATLVEAMPIILPGWKDELGEKAQETLRSRGIEIILGDPISNINKKGVDLKSGLWIESDLTIWTCGVECDPVCTHNFEMNGRRMSIDEYCHALGFNNIYVVGDAACAIEAETEKPMPPTAHIAMVQADIVSVNIHASLAGGEMRRYAGTRIGEIVTLGRTNAVGELWSINLKGTLAKIMKRIIHWWYVHSIGGFKLLLGL